MVNKNYARGKIKDVRCADDLRKDGYWSQEAHASKGIFDVVAVKDGVTRFIQVKRSKRNIVRIASIAHQYRDDIEALQKIPCAVTVSRELWLWIDKQKKVGEKGYQKEGWRKFVILSYGSLLEMS